MNPTSDTPETDQFILYSVRTDNNWRNFARQLEREKNNLRRKLDDALDQIVRMSDSKPPTRETE